MPHEVHASILFLLPDDPKEMANALSEVAGAWGNLLATFDPVRVIPTFTVNETRAKPAGSGAKRGRKPRTEAPEPELPV